MPGTWTLRGNCWTARSGWGADDVPKRETIARRGSSTSSSVCNGLDSAGATSDGPVRIVVTSVCGTQQAVLRPLFDRSHFLNTGNRSCRRGLSKRRRSRSRAAW